MHALLADRFPRGRNAPNALLLALAFACVLIGALAGWQGADRLQAQHSRAQLDQTSQRLLLRLLDILDEATALFAALEASGFDHCSDEQLLLMRTQLFDARFIKDIGGLAGSSLICSSALGRLTEALQSGPPDMLLSDGTGIRTDRSVLASASVRTMVIEHGRFNALVDPRLVTDLASNAEDGELFLRPLDWDGLTWHPFQRSGFDRLDQLRGQRRAGVMTGSHCSPRYALCLMLHRSDAAPASQLGETGFAISGLGGALGLALFLFGWSVWRQRETPEFMLRQALRQGDIKAVYQPIYSLPDRQLFGLEALARWTDRSGKLIPTEDFIALAERMAVIQEVTAVMLKRIGEELGSWLAADVRRHIAINIAPAELLDPGLSEGLERELLQRGVQARQILLEITERSLPEWQAAAKRIERLSARGFRIYADDFGVGYCGLAYLHELDMDGIKLSQTFTAALATDSPKAALVPRIVEMAREQGLAVIVEGVEKPEQVEALLALGPVLVQGWLFAREMKAEQVLATSLVDGPVRE